jgi:hypothetical protein
MSPFQVGTEVQLCHNPIFVIGSFRSGTTAIAKSLGRHSELWYSGHEANFVTFFFNRLNLDKLFQSGEFWFEKHEVTKEELSAAIGLGINHLFTSRSGGRRWIEKTPRNALVAPALATAFPDALFLHALRDGRSTVNSMRSFMRAIAPETQAKWAAEGFVPEWTKGFRHSVKIWQEHVDKGMSFAADQSERCLTVRYEELLSRPEEGFRSILGFLGVPFEQACLDGYVSGRYNSSFPGQQSASPVEAWKSWPTEDKHTFLEVAGESMVRSTYLSPAELEQLWSEVGADQQTKDHDVVAPGQNAAL